MTNGSLNPGSVPPPMAAATIATVLLPIRSAEHSAQLPHRQGVARRVDVEREGISQVRQGLQDRPAKLPAGPAPNSGGAKLATRGPPSTP